MPAGAIVFLTGSIEALILAGKGEEAVKLYPAMPDVAQSAPGVLDFSVGLHEPLAGVTTTATEYREYIERHLNDDQPIIGSDPFKNGV